MPAMPAEMYVIANAAPKLNRFMFSKRGLKSECGMCAPSARTEAHRTRVEVDADQGLEGVAGVEGPPLDAPPEVVVETEAVAPPETGTAKAP